MRKRICTAIFVLVAGMLVFACLYKSAFFLTLAQDEYIKTGFILDFARRLSGSGPVAVPSFVIPASFGGVRYWLMFNNYVGTAPFFFLLPFVALFSSVTGYYFAIKLGLAAVGVLTLVSIFVVLSAFDGVGRSAALLTVFLLVFNPSWIWAVRTGLVREEIFQVAGLWFGAALLCLSLRRGRRWMFYAGFFVFGLTLWAKIMFAGFMLGFLAGMLAVGLVARRRIQSMFFPARHHVFGAVAAFAVGAAPLLVFNFVCGFPTFRVLFDALVSPSGVEDWNNWNVVENLAVRLGDLWLYLSGAMFDDCASLSYPVPVMPVFFSAALLWAMACVFISGFCRDSLRRVLVFGLSFAGVLFFCTLFLPATHYSGHVLVLVPFAEALCAVFGVWLCRRRGGRGLLARVGLGLLCLLVIGLQSHKAVSVASDIENNRVNGYYVTEIRRLGAELGARPAHLLCSFRLGWMLKFVCPELDLCVASRSDMRSGAATEFLVREIKAGRDWRVLLADDDDYDRAFVRDSLERGVEIRKGRNFVFEGRGDKAISLCSVRLERYKLVSGCGTAVPELAAGGHDVAAL